MSLNCCSTCMPSLLQCYLENRELELQLQRQKAELSRLKFQQQLRALTDPDLIDPLPTLGADITGEIPRMQLSPGPEELSNELIRKYEHYGKTLKFTPPAAVDFSSKSTPRRRKPSRPLSDSGSLLDDTDLIPTKETAKPLVQIKKSIEKLRESAEFLHLTAKSVQTGDVVTAGATLKTSTPLSSQLKLELDSKSTSLKPEMSFSGSKHRTATPLSNSSSHSYRVPSPIDSLRDMQRLRFSSTLMSPLKESDLRSGGQAEGSANLAAFKSKFSLPPVLGSSAALRESSEREQKPGFTMEDLRKSSPSKRLGAIPKSSRGERYLPVTEMNGGLFSENGMEITIGSAFSSSLNGRGTSSRGGFRVYKDLEDALKSSSGTLFKVSCSDPSYTLKDGSMVCEQIFAKEVLRFGSSGGSLSRFHLD